MNLLEKRLNETDCLWNGWIVDSFPKTEAQIKMIENIKIHPSWVIKLHLE